MKRGAEKTRVGFDARWYNDTGVGAYVAGLLPALAASKNLELIVYENPSNPVPSIEGLAVKRVALQAKKYSAGEQFELARRCDIDGLDLLHCPFYVVPLFASCPVVVTFHDLIPFMFPIYSRAKATIVRQGYKLAAQKAAQIITDSAATAGDAERILDVPEERIHVVHLAPAECYRSKPQATDEKVLQKFGIKSPYFVTGSARNWQTKNLETALQALKIVHDGGSSEFDTVIYGHEDGLRAARRERWASLNLVCTGYISSSDLACLFRHANAFIMPSLYEGFGLPLVEAMACGCAVIASNRGALAEVAAEGAQLFDPMDARGMAGSLSRLLLDGDELARWRVAALKRSSDFSWEKAASETLTVYHRTHEPMLLGRVASNI